MKIFASIFITTQFFSINNFKSVETNNEIEKYKSRKVFENKERYGGDMLGLAPQQKGVMRKASSSNQRIWPNADVFYVFAQNVFTGNERSLVESAMKSIEEKTCVRFWKRTNKEPDYLRIVKGDGCYSYVGRIGGAQDLSLGRGCLYRGTVIHELMHSIGFYHEHMRSDRDQYLTINMKNVMPGMGANFEKNPNSQNRLLTKFDYNSIMIYSSTAFSKDGQKTMEPKDKNYHLKEPYDKSQMTSLDALSVNKMYDCIEN